MILVAYASKYGSTREVAEHLAARLTDLGQDAAARPVGEITSLGSPSAVVVGSPIYNGAWLPEATAFVTGNADALAEMPTWLFSVGPLGADYDAPEVDIGVVSELVSPTDQAVFFGALDQETLDDADKTAMTASGASAGDFRDWDAITAWAEAIAGELA